MDLRTLSSIGCLVLGALGLGGLGCAPPIVQAKSVHLMASETAASSCEVVSVVHVRLFLTPDELKDPNAIVARASEKIRSDARRVGANYVHVDQMDAVENDVSGTAYNCPAAFRNDNRVAVVRYVDADGKARVMNLPHDDAPATTPANATASNPTSTTTTTSAVMAFSTSSAAAAAAAPAPSASATTETPPSSSAASPSKDTAKEAAPAGKAARAGKGKKKGSASTPASSTSTSTTETSSAEATTTSTAATKRPAKGRGKAR